MNKTWIILKSEFTRRITSKWFIASTLLAPVLIVAMLAVPGLVMHFSAESGERVVVVIDETEVLLPRLQEEGSARVIFVLADQDPDPLRQDVRAGDYDGMLLLTEGLRTGEGSATYYATEGGGLSFRSQLNGLVRRAVEAQRLEDIGASSEVIDIIRSGPSVSMVTLTDEGERADGTPVLSAVGYLMGFSIWFAVIIYGSLVMSSVIEEKTSRVMEVVVSSVRPFNLLLGKVLGIGAAGLLQMIAWGMLIFAITAFGATILATFMDPTELGVGSDASSEAVLEAAGIAIPPIPLGLIAWFVLFFVGGYLLYASLYAAIGSAVQEHQDAQTVAFPVMFILMIPIFMLGMVIDSPNSTASFALSMVPFFSPVLMVVREAVADIALWQTTLSFLLLVCTFFASIWISSRIYRVGILMYGKKPSFRDLARWLRQA